MNNGSGSVRRHLDSQSVGLASHVDSSRAEILIRGAEFRVTHVLLNNAERDAIDQCQRNMGGPQLMVGDLNGNTSGNKS